MTRLSSLPTHTQVNSTDVLVMLFCGLGFIIFGSAVSSNNTTVTPADGRRQKRFLKAFPCLQPECILSFDSQEKLDQHEQSGEHTDMASVQDPTDRNKLLIGKHTTNINGNKFRAKNKTNSVAQIDFSDHRCLCLSFQLNTSTGAGVSKEILQILLLSSIISSSPPVQTC